MAKTSEPREEDILLQPSWRGVDRGPVFEEGRQSGVADMYRGVDSFYSS